MKALTRFAHRYAVQSRCKSLITTLPPASSSRIWHAFILLHLSYAIILLWSGPIQIDPTSWNDPLFIRMSNSFSAMDRWGQILSQKQNYFSMLGSNRISLVTNQASFRQYFEDECEQLKQIRRQTLLGRLFTSFRRRESFIHILNRATLNQEYVGLIWGASFAVIEVSLIFILFTLTYSDSYSVYRGKAATNTY